MNAFEDKYICKYDECLGIQRFDSVEAIRCDGCSQKGFFLRFKSATVTGTKFSDVVLLRKKDLGNINTKEYNEWVLLGNCVVVHTRIVLIEKNFFKRYIAI